MSWIFVRILNLFLFVDSAMAQGGGDTLSVRGTQSISLPNPLGCNDLVCIADRITSVLFQIAIPIATIMVLIGGLQLLTSGGNEKKIEKGKKTLLYAVVGFAAVVLANGVVYIIQDIFSTGA